MALEDRIRSSVDQAVQSLVTDVLSIHTDEANRRLDEATELVRAAEAQTRTELEQQLAQAHANTQAAIDEAVRVAVDAERARLVFGFEEFVEFS